MVIRYDPLACNYVIECNASYKYLMAIEASSVREFTAMLGRQPEAYQLLAYIGYGMAKAAAENDSPMLDALVEKYGGRFE